MEKVRVYKEKFSKTVREQLTQGVTPEKLALTVVLGFVFGLIPVLGVNMFVLAFIALRLRLNMVLIQIVNFAVYPLQLMLLVPFFKAGQWMFRTENAVAISVSDFVELFSTNFLHAASEFGFVILKGITAWSMFSIPVGIIIYSIFVVLFRNLLVQIAGKRR